jgi:hypothetical protein
VRNEEGCKLLKFSEAHALMVNAQFKRSKDRFITCRSGEDKSAMDYVLVRGKDRKRVIPSILHHV